MNKYNFDQIIDRRNTKCAKHDEMDEKFKEYGENFIHLGVADMDFKVPEPIIEEFRKITEHGIFGYTNLDDGYFTSIQEWMKKRFDLDIPKEWILYTPKIMVAGSLAVSTFTTEEDSVLVNTPVYSPLKNIVLKNNRRVIESSLKLIDGVYYMDFDDMEEKIDKTTKMIIFCNPHNPTGRVWDKEQLIQLARFCEKHDLIIYSDEVHFDIVAKNVIHTPMINVCEDIKKRCILGTSITKTFNLPGLMIGNLIIPNPTIREKLQQSIDKTWIHKPNIYAASAVEAAYTKCDGWVEELNIYIRDNIQFVEAFLNQCMPEFKVIKSQGTYLMWIDYSALNISKDQLEKWFLKEVNVSVYFGTNFSQGGENFIRINVATRRALLEEALERMKLAYHKIIKKVM